MYLNRSSDYEAATAVFTVIGAVVGVVALAIAAVVLNGFVFTVLWGWFIAEYFSVRPLSTPEAIGLSLIVSFLTYRAGLKKEERSVWHDIGLVFGIPLFALLFGWFIHLFM